MPFWIVLIGVLLGSPAAATTACFGPDATLASGQGLKSWYRHGMVPCTDTVVTLPQDTPVDRRTQKWNGTRVVSKAAAEIAAYDAAQPVAQAQANVQAFKGQCAAIQADPVAPPSSKDLCAALLKVVK